MGVCPHGHEVEREGASFCPTCGMRLEPLPSHGAREQHVLLTNATLISQPLVRPVPPQAGHLGPAPLNEGAGQVAPLPYPYDSGPLPPGLGGSGSKRKPVIITLGSILGLAIILTVILMVTSGGGGPKDHYVTVVGAVEGMCNGTVNGPTPQPDSTANDGTPLFDVPYTASDGARKIAHVYTDSAPYAGAYTVGNCDL